MRNIRTEARREGKKALAIRQGPWAAYLIPVLFFTGLWLFGRLGVYSDSQQYIAMHIHREPLYPFFLWIFRALLGEGRYLEAVRFFQNLLACLSVCCLTACLRREFRTGRVLTFLFSLLLLAPHIITPFFSVTRLVFSNGILSEALGLPLFYLFLSSCVPMLLRRSKKSAAAALGFALLLSLTRGQMMAVLLLWAVTAGFLCLTGKRRGQVVLVLAAVLLAFGCRTALVRGYNRAFNGYWMDNTFGSVSFLANVLYAADEQDGERIQDEEARAYFDLSFGLAMERGANYREAPKGLLNRAAHLEQWHDELKFKIIEEPWRQIHDEAGFQDYILENVEQDRIAATITKSLFPAVLGRWLYDYLALSVCGLIRTAAVVHPLLNWYALFFYLFLLAGAGFLFRKDTGSAAAKFAAFSLLTAAANVYSTSLVIMCLSRYMIYAFPVLYIAALLLLLDLYRLYRTRRKDG